MTIKQLQKLAKDLRLAKIEAIPSEAPPDCKLHMLTINGVDFYFRADDQQPQYDGWGSSDPNILRDAQQPGWQW